MRLLIFLSLFLAVTFLHAQDQIYKADGTVIKAKVLEVGSSEIRYKNPANPDGPVYVLPRAEVQLVTYENGQFDIIQPKGNAVNAAGTEIPDVKYGNNIISYNYFDLVFLNLYFSYERILLKGNLGLRVPFIADFSNSANNFPFNKSVASGLEINYYPTGQGKVKYFIGPSAEVGYLRKDQTTYSINCQFWPGDPSCAKKEVNLSYYFVGLNNGILFQPVTQLSVGLNFALGLQDVEGSGSGPEPNVRFVANVGFRF